jgi:hypothetical protein
MAPDDARRDGRSGISLIAELADREARKADHLEARPAFDKTDAFLKRIEAGRARGEAARLLDALPPTLVGSPETELVPGITRDTQAPIPRITMVDTLAIPDVISVDASEQRAMGAHRVGVLSAALDTAKSARASNSIEKMLCHQLAAVHDAGMELLTRFREAPIFGPLQVADVVRLSNGAARLFDSSQNGCLVLQKLKTGGTQRVLVQHQQLVNVEKGGQAIVAGKLKPGSRTRGRGRKNAQ